MSRIVLLFCVMIFASWVYHFDADEYAAQQNGSAAMVKKPNLSSPTISSESLAEEDLIFPIPNKSLQDVISGYGDPRAGGKRRHEGVDVPAERGTPVVAVTTGTITKVADRGNAGKQIWLRSAREEVSYFYAHLDSWCVEEGQSVKRGAVIGAVGNTGNARHTLPHLHFEVRQGKRQTIDPALVLP